MLFFLISQIMLNNLFVLYNHCCFYSRRWSNLISKFAPINKISRKSIRESSPDSRKTNFKIFESTTGIQNELNHAREYESAHNAILLLKISKIKLSLCSIRKLNPMNRTSAVLLIFTGGTISMMPDAQTGALRPVDFNTVIKLMPELNAMRIKVRGLPLLPLVDSSDINPDVWERIALCIKENYEDYDGFVVLHGTDTMSYSASALSFMLTGLRKPVIFTGSQIPIGVLRTDAKENLITAIEIAAAKIHNRAIVPEVCLFFEDKLFRANRTSKQNSEQFSAFKSFNYPPLAEAGVHIKYFHQNISTCPDENTQLHVRTKTDRNIAILKIFPGITQQTVNGILSIPGLKAVILETFGAGNAPRGEWFYNALKTASQQGIIIVNKSQCSGGSVEMGLYETSLNLLNAGVISGYDITTEALVAKLMYLLGENDDSTQVKAMMNKSLCGEITPFNQKWRNRNKSL